MFLLKIMEYAEDVDPAKVDMSVFSFCWSLPKGFFSLLFVFRLFVFLSSCIVFDDYVFFPSNFSTRVVQVSKRGQDGLHDLDSASLQRDRTLRGRAGDERLYPCWALYREAYRRV